MSLSAITLLTMLFAPAIVGLYTTRLPHNAAGEAERDLATFFLRWFMPQIVFYGLGAVASGLLNAHRRFAAPMFAPILNNLTVIATMVLFVALPRPAVGISDVQRYVLANGGDTESVSGWNASRSRTKRFATLSRWSARWSAATS